jgi:hypothetical protein
MNLLNICRFYTSSNQNPARQTLAALTHGQEFLWMSQLTTRPQTDDEQSQPIDVANLPDHHARKENQQHDPTTDPAAPPPKTE